MKKVFIIVLLLSAGLLSSASAGLRQGLVGYWPLDTDTLDYSGNERHGQLNGSASTVPGVVGDALHFEGGYVDLGTWNPSGETGQLSVSHWVTWDGSGATWQGSVAKRDGWAADNMMWMLELSTNNNGGLTFQQEGSYPGLSYEIPPDGQTWVHVVVTFDGTTATMYVNGQLHASGGFEFGTDTESALVIGASEPGGNLYSGNIDEVAIWDRPLTAEEVAALYADGAGMSPMGHPWKATSPTPADEAIEVSSDGVTLTWEPPVVSAPGPITGYAVYFGDDYAVINDPNRIDALKGTVVAGETLAMEISGAELAPNSVYYWRVDTLAGEIGDPNNAAGLVWSFATETTVPVIADQPQDVVVAPGEDAVFELVLRGDLSLLEPVAYRWYDSQGTLLVDGGRILGAATSRLTVAGVDRADNGASFYCVATNADGSVQSDAASITVKLLVAHYPLDETGTAGDPNIYDISGGGHNGIAMGDTSSVAGVVGTALYFDGTGDYIDLGTWNPSEGTGELSISMWVAWDGSAGGLWQGPIGKRDDWNAADMMWTVEVTKDTDWASYGDFSLKQPDSDPGPLYDLSGADDGQTWVHTVFTYDGSTVSLYVNGEFAGSSGFQFGSDPDSALVIGSAQAGGDNGWAGMIDDVRIYNYAIDAVQIARLYTRVAGGSICNSVPDCLP